jgi:hypothetical protein
MVASNLGGRACDERLELIRQEGRCTGGDVPWASGELAGAPLLSAPMNGARGIFGLRRCSGARDSNPTVFGGAHGSAIAHDGAPFFSCSQRDGSARRHQHPKLAEEVGLEVLVLLQCSSYDKWRRIDVHEEDFLVDKVCSYKSKLDWFMPVFTGVYCSRHSRDGLRSILSINKFKLVWIGDQIKKGEILLEMNSQVGWFEWATRLTRVRLWDGARLGIAGPQLNQLGRDLGHVQEKVNEGWAGLAPRWPGFRPKHD